MSSLQMPGVDIRAVAPGLRIRAPGCQGLQIFGGRTETATGLNGSGLTYEFAMELPARSAKAVGSLIPILGVSKNGSTNPAAFVDAKFVSALTDLDATLSATTCTFGDGASTANQLTLPAAATQRGHIFTDENRLAPIARSDGGADKPWAAARAFVGNFTTMFLGKSGDDFTNWSTRAAGKVRMRVNSTIGDQRTSTANWVATSSSPVVGFGYSHEGPIYNGMGIGDSIDEGRGTYLNESVGLLACEAINAGSPKTWQSFSNLAWSGQTTTNMVQNLADLISWGVIPDWIVFPCGSPNDADPLTDASIDICRANLIRMLGLCAQHRICPIVRSFNPCNYAVHAWGATDAKRLAYNIEIAAFCALAGIEFFDQATVVAGAVEGHGQQELNATYSDDGIHPNSAGNAASMPVLKANIQTIQSGRL